jgi:hypothetical protein
LALRFALSAPPYGLRRAALRAKPTDRKNRDPVSRPRKGSSFLGHPEARFFEKTTIASKKRQTTKKGDISIEVRKGTFLKSFDTNSSAFIDLTVSHDVGFHPRF